MWVRLNIYGNYIKTILPLVRGGSWNAATVIGEGSLYIQHEAGQTQKASVCDRKVRKSVKHSTYTRSTRAHICLKANVYV